MQVNWCWTLQTVPMHGDSLYRVQRWHRGLTLRPAAGQRSSTTRAISPRPTCGGTSPPWRSRSNPRSVDILVCAEDSVSRCPVSLRGLECRVPNSRAPRQVYASDFAEVLDPPPPPPSPTRYAQGSYPIVYLKRHGFRFRLKSDNRKTATESVRRSGMKWLRRSTKCGSDTRA